MKKMLVVLACLAAVILFAYPAGAQNDVFAGADSIHWRYENGKLVGFKTVAVIDSVPKGIPASIAGQLVEGKIPKYVRVEEKQIGISKFFSISTLSRAIQSRTEIVYSKVGGWKEDNLPSAVIEQNSHVSFALFIILPAVFTFLITLTHFFNFGKIKLKEILIFYISILSLILIGGLINALTGTSLGIAALVVAIIGAVVCAITGIYANGVSDSGGAMVLGLFVGALIGFTVGGFILPEVIWQYFLFFALVCVASLSTVQIGAWLIGKIVLRRKAKTAAA